MMENKINTEHTYLGIEFGSTRIKAVLIDDGFSVLATGAHTWENRLEGGYWTYSLDDIHAGLAAAYADLKREVRARYGTVLCRVGAIGISGMMHGYLPFDREGRLLAPFRTWRNTTTAAAADELTALFGFNIPQRWSIAHLWQAILNGEAHTRQIARINTLAGYIHTRLTGRHEVGIGEASGIFPVGDGGYDPEMLDKFRTLAAARGYALDLNTLLPAVCVAGDTGAILTEEGARLLDPAGDLRAGIPLCPPEGDAGTGMVATNAVRKTTGNLSAGTSVFSMLVLERPLARLWREIDVVATPDGAPVAMVHCNNGCSELDYFVGLFGEFARLSGAEMDTSALYELLYRNTEAASPDCGGAVAYNFLAGEPVIGVEEGRPMYFRSREGSPSLADFFRAQLYATIAPIKIGMDILTVEEGARISRLSAHGGLFKVSGVAQAVLANALETPVTVQRTAGEGGAFGMAVLAAYMMKKDGRPLPDFLDECVFSEADGDTRAPDEAGVRGFAAYLERYRAGLSAVRELKGEL